MAKRKIGLRAGFLAISAAFLIGIIALLQSSNLSVSAAGDTSPTAAERTQMAFPSIAPAASIAALDDVYITATWIVGRATDAAAFHLTSTACALGLCVEGINPLVATATLAPSLIPQEDEDLITRWMGELEGAAGFKHPIFSTIAYEFLSAAVSNTELRDYIIHPLIVRVKYAGYEYVGLIIYHPITSYVDMYLFRLLSGQPTLMMNGAGFSYYLGYMPAGIEPPQFSFADLNRNGLPDFEIFAWSGGNCPSADFQLLEIQPNGDVAIVAGISTSVILPPPNPFNVIWQLETPDLNADGMPELKVTERFFEYVGQPNVGCNFLPLVHYYRWNGKAYEDITSTLPVTDYPEIDSYFKSIEQPTCRLPDLAMDQMLIDYVALGHLKDGWARLEPQLHWELCSPETLTKQGTLMGELLVWIGTYLEKEQQNQSKSLS